MSKVSDIGERSLIQRIMKHLTPMPDMPIPFWDDASALSLGDGRAIVINTDMLVWETDVPVGMSPYQAARKAVVMNVSDLGAKGVQPIAFMPNIGIPDDYDIVRQILRRRGAYARYKALLDQRGMLEEWFKMENSREEKAIREWCEENGIEFDRE